MVGKDATVRDLPAEIADFYDAIVEKVGLLRVDAHQTMSHIKNEREELASQLQRDLARGESLRKADFQKLIGEVIEMRKAREQEVMDLLAQFHQEEQDVVLGLKKLFNDSKQARLRDFKKFIADTRKTTRTRQAEVEEIAHASEETIATFREEREEMARSWNTLAEKMQSRRPSKTMPGSKNGASHSRSPRVTHHAASSLQSTKAKKQAEG